MSPIAPSVTPTTQALSQQIVLGLRTSSFRLRVKLKRTALLVSPTFFLGKKAVRKFTSFQLNVTFAGKGVEFDDVYVLDTPATLEELYFYLLLYGVLTV